MKSSVVKPRNQAPSSSNISKKMDEILEAYSTRLKRSSQRYRPLVLYCLTDGRWEGRDMMNFRDIIMAFARDLAVITPGDHQAGIQIILFGDDEEAVGSFQKLLDYVKYSLAEVNLINVEPARGNVMKMLLGSITRDHDLQQDSMHEPLYPRRPTFTSDLEFSPRPSVPRASPGSSGTRSSKPPTIAGSVFSETSASFVFGPPTVDPTPLLPIRDIFRETTFNDDKGKKRNSDDGKERWRPVSRE